FDYRVGTSELVCRPTAHGRAGSLITIGGSFLYQILDPILEGGLFRQVENYFYYDTLYQRWPGPKSERPDPAKFRWRDRLPGTGRRGLGNAEALTATAPHSARIAW